jgi:hypothetical protein
MVNDDSPKPGRELATRVALAAGRDAARAALDDLLLSDAEKAARAAARTSAVRKKILVAVVVATVVGIGVIALLQLFATLWLWAVGAVVVAGVIGVLALVMKPRLDALRRRLTERRAAADAASAALQEEQRQQRALADAARARVAAQRAVDDELERLKRQAGR